MKTQFTSFTFYRAPLRLLVTTGPSALCQTHSSKGLITATPTPTPPLLATVVEPPRKAEFQEQDNVPAARKMQMSFLQFCIFYFRFFLFFEETLMSDVSYVGIHTNGDVDGQMDGQKDQILQSHFQGERRSDTGFTGRGLGEKWYGGDFWPPTDHRSASINMMVRPAEGGHPTGIPQIRSY